MTLSAPPWSDSEKGQKSKLQLIQRYGLIAVLRGAAAFIRITNGYGAKFSEGKARNDLSHIADDGAIHEDAVHAIVTRARIINEEWFREHPQDRNLTR